MSSALMLIEHPSPNHGPRPSGTVIDTLVLHYTGMATVSAALDRLADPAAMVSAHYLIDEDGSTYRLVPEERRAWHAGLGYWRGHADLNSRSIGIELVNPGHDDGYRPFPADQMASLITLSRSILARHPIPARNVIGHSDLAPGRKTDPGELFDWRLLAAYGIGWWPDPGSRSACARALRAQPDIVLTRWLLGRYGYAITTGAGLDSQARLVLAAFQRHFRPQRVDGRLDQETFIRVLEVAGQL